MCMGTGFDGQTYELVLSSELNIPYRRFIRVRTACCPGLFRSHVLIILLISDDPGDDGSMADVQHSTTPQNCRV